MDPSFLLLAHMENLSSAAMREAGSETSHGPDDSSINNKDRIEFYKYSVFLRNLTNIPVGAQDSDRMIPFSLGRNLGWAGAGRWQ